MPRIRVKCLKNVLIKKLILLFLLDKNFLVLYSVSTKMKTLFISILCFVCATSCMQKQSWWPKKHHTKLSQHDHKHSLHHSEDEKLPGHHHHEDEPKIKTP